MTDEQIRIMVQLITALTEIKTLEKQLVVVGQHELAFRISDRRVSIARNILLFLDTLGMDYSMLENDGEC